MATNTRTSVMTMMDAAETIGADRNQLEVIDVLSQKTILRDAHWVESNDYTTHHYMQTLSQPTGSDTIYNQGVAWEIGTERPVTEIIQGLESYSKIDARILQDHPNPEQLRRMKDTETVRGMRYSVDDRIFYGNSATGKTTSVSPDQILGLTGRFNAISAATYNEIQSTSYWDLNVVSAGGSTASVQSSAWAIKWGDDGAFLIYPRSGKGFVDVQPLPEQTLVYDGSNNPYLAEITHFSISFGLGVGDWRNVCRLCNINKGTDSKPWTSDLMIQLMSVFPDGWEGVYLYVDRTVWQQVQLEAKNNANNFHFDDAPWGGITPYFMTIPVQLADRLVNTESVVS